MAAPQITPLPPAPQRNEAEADFVSKANAFVAALDPFRQEANTSADFMDTKAAEADTSATNAAASATAAADSEANAEISETNAATSESNAAGSASASATSEAQSLAYRDETQQLRDDAAASEAQSLAYRNETLQLRDDAAAVVTGGDATFEPEPGKIPLADANGQINEDWLGNALPNFRLGQDRQDNALLIADESIRSSQEMQALAIFDGGTDEIFVSGDYAEDIQSAAGVTANYGETVAVVADKSGSGNDGAQASSSLKPVLGRMPATGRRNLLDDTDALATQSVTLAAGDYVLSFAGSGSVDLSGAHTATVDGGGVGAAAEYAFTASAGSLTLTVTGTVAEAQLEVGSVATTYQRVTSDYDITESGVPSVEYLRFDHVDDKMTHTLTNGVTGGTLLVAGTKGSWVSEGVDVAAAGDLDIGPKDMPDQAGAFAALGEVVGWMLLDRAFTRSEKRFALDYYKQRGAKGQLVPSGVELLENGTFDTNLTGWTTTTWVWDAGAAKADGVNGAIAQSVGQSGGSGKVFRVRFDQEIVSGTRLRPRIRDHAQTQDLFFTYVTGTTSVDLIVVSPDDGLYISFISEAANVVRLDDVSVQELAPEEDLA